MIPRLPTRDRRALTLVALAVCALAPVWAWANARDARGELSAARAAHDAVLAQAQRWDRLVATAPVAGEAWRPESDLVARVGHAMRAAGLGPDALTRLNVSDPQPTRDPALRRQSVAISVEGVTPGDAARFLVEWTVAEPQWTVRSVRMQRRQPRRGDSGDPGWTALIAVEAVYIHTESGRGPGDRS